MKKKQRDELKGLNSEELVKKLEALHVKLRDLKFKTQGAKSKNVKEQGALKKDIARVLTALTESNKSNKKD